MDKGDSPKDFWDKIGTLSTLFSSVVIAAVGLWATNEFNNKQLEINQLQQQQQSEIELTKELEDLYPFLSDKDAGKRKFGYAMFVALGKEDLALSLINSNSDSAGQSIAETLSTSANEATRTRALSVVNSLKLHQWLAPVSFKAATPTSADGGASTPPASAEPASASPSPSTSINPVHLGALQHWMNQNSSDPALKGVPVTALLNSTNPALEAARARAVSDLVRSSPISAPGSP